MTDQDNAWKLVPLERSYDMRARAILAFNTATANGADRDDALQAAWEAEFHTAPQNRQKDNDSAAGNGDGMALTGRQLAAPAAQASSRVSIDRHYLNQATTLLRILTGHDMGANLRATYGEDWWKKVDALRENLSRAAMADQARPAPDTEIEALFEGRAENTAVISADHAVNIQRAEIIARAVAAHGRAWPEQLTSGVMFYEGERITRAEFLAEVGQ